MKIPARKVTIDECSPLMDPLFTSGVVSRAVLSGNPQSKKDEEAVERIDVRAVLIRGERNWQFSHRSAKKMTHVNLRSEEAAEELLRLFSETFRNCLITAADQEIQLQKQKDGSLILRGLTASKNDINASKFDLIPLNHDRTKQYILPDNVPCDFLIKLGVMSSTGKVIAQKWDKFRQINRFLEMVADVSSEIDSTAALRIIDFGCGKAYLTFALYHYFTAIKKREVKIVGLDLKSDVVEFCSKTAKDLDYSGLTFQQGTIRDFANTEPADMVVCLHACDTATDDALADAVRREAKVILAVPCCQHELLSQIDNPRMRPLLKHGLIRERLSSLITDSVRGLLLESKGYSVDMLEFVDLEHTPKNLLIRAVKNGTASSIERASDEYSQFRNEWCIHPVFEEMIKSPSI